MTFHPTQRIESYGSMWLLDETSMHYVRMPKGESPRQSPPGEDWGGVDADPSLIDLALIPFREWEISEEHFTMHGDHADGSEWEVRRKLLIIRGERTVRAPMMECQDYCEECF